MVLTCMMLRMENLSILTLDLIDLKKKKKNKKTLDSFFEFGILIM